MSWDYVNSILPYDEYIRRAKLGRKKQIERIGKDEDLRKHMSAQSKKNIAKAHEQGRHINAGFSGKKHSDETKQKISALKKGRYKGKDNSSFGSKWCFNQRTGKERKFYNLDEMANLSNDWIIGKRAPK